MISITIALGEKEEGDRGERRSVCSNIAEAWRNRRYEAALSKLNDSEGEATEFAVHCGYVGAGKKEKGRRGEGGKGEPGARRREESFSERIGKGSGDDG
jgi:hypothetical protein